MTRPKLLDLFCCAGGAGTGYHRAGFDVIGVDIDPQPRYPFEFAQGDALAYLRLLIAGRKVRAFDAIHASPPCHDHSRLSSIPGRTNGTDWLLPATRELLIGTGLPYVIENVVGAKMIDPIRLCGSQFDLTAHDPALGETVRLERHRLFESNLPIVGGGGCRHDRTVQVAGVYGHNSSTDRAIMRRTAYVPSTPVRRTLMGIDWMTRDELSQSIPPAYTEHVGRQLIGLLR